MWKIQSFLVLVLVLACSGVAKSRENQVQSHSNSNTNAQGNVITGVFGMLRNFFGQRASRNSGSGSGLAIPREAFMSTPELIRHHGYPMEEQKVETKDGFLLTMFRIPRGKAERAKDAVKKEPVLLLHCFLCSSDDFLLLPNPKDNLPYLLAEDGHDVWLGNIRGNGYSQGNIHGIKQNDPDFYDFSMDEPGIMDVPAMIHHILKVTGAEKLSISCHSMGCGLIVMAIHEFPKLNDKIKKMSLLAPGIYASNTSPPIRALNAISEQSLQTFANRFAGGRMFPSEIGGLIKRTGPLLCNREGMKELCAQITSLFTGLNVNNIITDKTMLKIYGHTPSDTSMKLFIHYRQLVASAGFHKFDYGEEKNRQMYGQPNPPAYNLSTIRVPVQGFYSLKDTNVLSADALKTFNELDNSENVDVIQVADPEFVHIDFLYAKTAKFAVYDDVIRFLSS